MKKCRLIIIYFIILSINLKGQIQNNQPRDNNHIINKTIFNLDELKVRWRKASLENCPEGKCPVFTTPGPVRALMVSPLPLSAIVSFLPPLNDGGSLITGYVVTAQQTASAPAKRKLSSTITVSGISSPILVTGLAFGVNYNFNPHCASTSRYACIHKAVGLSEFLFVYYRFYFGEGALLDAKGVKQLL
jgi:hypothetical protein